MSQSKFSLLIGALALTALTVGGSGAARADEIVFGNITPSSGLGTTSPECTHAGSDPGFVCNNGQTFTAEGDTFTAKGYTGNFGTSVTASALTWKPNNAPAGFTVSNSLGESGLGENLNPPTYPPTALQMCSDPTCEDNNGASVLVSVTSGSLPIIDVVIGSVQQNAEQFELFGATTLGGTLNPISFGGNTTFNSGNCQDYSSADATCTFDLTGDNFLEVGLSEVMGIGGAESDALITAVSVPAPIIGQGLPVALAIGSLLFGARLWERSKKRRSPESAMPHAMA